MKHGSTADLLDLFENPLGLPDSFSDPIFLNPIFLNHTAAPAGNNAVLPPPALPDESIEAESAQNGSGGLGSVVAETSGGLVINLLFDAAAMAAPLSFRQGIEQAAAILSGAISDKITVNLDIDYSGTGGGAAAGPDNGQYVSYTTIRADLINDATAGDTTFNALPSGSTIQGQSSIAVWNAQLKLFGLLGANDTTTDDGSATFATDINPNLLVGVALHELTHAMGRVPYGPQPDIFDLFRFTSPGTRLLLNGATAPAAYFSLDGGTTKVADYGQTSDASDFLNSGVQGSNDPFNEFYSGSTLQQLTAIDLKQLNALGFHLISSQPTVIEAFGSTSLVEIGANYYLDGISSGSGPELKLGGVSVVVGQSTWAPIGAEQTAGGYEVALKDSASGDYTVWNTDASGNVVSDTIGHVTGTSTGLEALEPSFQQDLNGDGVIGIPAQPATVIESFGLTSLVEVGANYYLDSISSGSGPELKLGGVSVVVGQSTWAPIGAEQTAGGYEVALKDSASGDYTVWNTDASGNVVSDTIGHVTGTSTALEALEPSFHQDLNGDGVIGIPAQPATVIESFGSTSLVQSANSFTLDSISNGSGPELKLGGVIVVPGQSTWAPIGAEQTAGGYEVALKDSASGDYTVWNTDASGNVVSDTIGHVTGTSTGLEALEPSFQQDLNGDGVIGIPAQPATVIESFGLTSLVEVGANYYLDSISSGSGPELKLGGVSVVVGQSTWAPIGAEQTAGGYEVALKDSASGDYTVWNTDASGNVVSDTIGHVTGTSTALEALEPSFHQDLNGDGILGVPSGSSVATPAAITTAMGSSANDTFAFLPSSEGSDANGRANKIGLDEFSIPPNNVQLTEFQQDTRYGNLQTLLQSASEKYSEISDNHVGRDLFNIHVAGHSFMIH